MKLIEKTLTELRGWPVDNISAAVVLRKKSVWQIFTWGEVDKVYSLASITKTLTAYSIYIALVEAAIDLTTSTVIPGATVANLLSHSSGLGYTNASNIVAEPGVQRIYSNYGYELLAKQLEQATDISFSCYMQEALFTPLRMRTAALMGPAGFGAQATIKDLIPFIQEILQPQLIPFELATKVFEPHLTNLPGELPGYGYMEDNAWSYGFELRGTKQPHWMPNAGSVNLVGHFGQSGTYIWCDRQNNFAIVVLTDRKFGGWARKYWQPFNDKIYTSCLQEIA